jgi:hypothetical protein
VRRTPRGGSGTVHGLFPEVELLNLQKIGQFPDEPVKLKDSQIHYVNTLEGFLLIVGLVINNN